MIPADVLTTFEERLADLPRPVTIEYFQSGGERARPAGPGRHPLPGLQAHAGAPGSDQRGQRPGGAAGSRAQPPPQPRGRARCRSRARDRLPGRGRAPARALRPAGPALPFRRARRAAPPGARPPPGPGDRGHPRASQGAALAARAGDGEPRCIHDGRGDRLHPRGALRASPGGGLRHGNIPRSRPAAEDDPRAADRDQRRPWRRGRHDAGRPRRIRARAAGEPRGAALRRSSPGRSAKCSASRRNRRGSGAETGRS